MSRWRPGERVASRFVIEGWLASGGMAEVYVAEAQLARSVRRRVALKRIHSHLAEDPHFLTMFLDEARLASQLAHPGVVSVHDVVESDGELLLVLDYVPGWDLSSVLREARTKPVAAPLGVAVVIAQAVASTLAYVHGAKDHTGAPLRVVHRDVNPSNILIAEDGSVRLLDFGVAKAAERATQTATRSIKGKLAYLAPEQATAGAVDGRTDLYGLGLTLFEMVTGDRALSAGGDIALLDLARNPQIRPLDQVRHDVPRELSALTEGLLAVDPSGRPRDASAVVTELETLRALITGATGEQVRAYVTSVMGVASRPVRQGRRKFDRALAKAAGVKLGPGTAQLPKGAGWGGDQPNEGGWGAQAAAGGTTPRPNEGGFEGTEPNENRWGADQPNANPSAQLHSNENRWGADQPNESGWGADQPNENPLRGPRRAGREGTSDFVPWGSDVRGPRTEPEDATSPSLVAKSRAATIREAGPIAEEDSTPDILGAPTELAPRRRVVAPLLGAGVAALLVAGVWFGTRPSFVPPEPAAPTAKQAFLRVTSEPAGAWIDVGGDRLTDRTPAIVSVDAARDHDVQVGLDDHEPSRTMVAARAGETHRVHLVLARARGWLRVISKPPGATVTVDGEAKGATPLVLEQLARRAIEVSASKRGYRSAKRTVDLSTTASTTVELVLSRRVATGTLDVSSTPWARVSIDGKLVAESTPLIGYRLPVGRHRVKLENPRLGKRATRNVVIKKGRKSSLIVRLD